MKLNYSTSLITTIYLHIIFIHIIYTQLCLAAPSQDQYKANLLKQVLNLKEVPKSLDHKAYIAPALLAAYMENREAMRETIPDDRDYYGKISIDELDNFHADLYGPNQGIEVDMIADTEAIGHKFLFKQDVNLISQLHCQNEPEEVASAIAQSLPPTLRTRDSPRQFHSVHLKFNLSQELFIRPLSVDDLKGAELHLGRERWFYCGDEDSRNTQPTSDSNYKSNNITNHNFTEAIGHPIVTSDEHAAASRTEYDSCNGPRYQRIYILSIIGYDQHNEPITRIHDSQLIDTIESTEVMFDIKDIVQSWIGNPMLNHGIIVRVSYDEDELKELRQTVAESAGSTNASLVKALESLSGLQDHVRLRRGFESASESEEAWSMKRPTIFLFSDAPGRVKRDNNNRNPGVRSQTSTNTNNQKNKRKKTPKPPAGCSLKTQSINFDDVGWSNWIIAPTQYLFNFCSGDCSHPLLDFQNATNHAIIQSIYHSVGRVVPRSCCAPIRLGKMAILYQLDGSVQMRHYDDMIAEACGCS